jgi:putative transposase
MKRIQMPIKPEHLDELLAGYEKPEDLLGEVGLFKQLKKALLERALGAELTHHLGYEGDPAGRGTGNNRNGTSAKTVLTEDGSVEIDVPRDRNGSFEPQIVAKGETRLGEHNPLSRAAGHVRRAQSARNAVVLERRFRQIVTRRGDPGSCLASAWPRDAKHLAEDAELRIQRGQTASTVSVRPSRRWSELTRTRQGKEIS